MRNRKKDLEEKQTKSRRKRRREKEELVRIEELEEDYFLPEVSGVLVPYLNMLQKDLASRD